MRRIILLLTLGLLFSAALIPAQAQNARVDFFGTGLCRDNIGIGQVAGAFGEGTISPTTNAGFNAPECVISNSYLMLVFSPQLQRIRFTYSTRGGGQMQIQALRGTKILNEARLSGEGRQTYDFSDVIDRIIITEVSGGQLFVDEFELWLAPGQANDAPWNPRDGRIAPHAGATINLFCDPARGLSVHSELVRTSFVVGLGGAVPGQNTLIRSFRGVQLYRLTDGAYQAMDVINRDGRIDLLIAYVDNTCAVSRWRRGYYYPNGGFTEIYAQSEGWGDAPRRY